MPKLVAPATAPPCGLANSMLLVRSTLLAATPLQLNSALAPSARPRGGRVALVSTSPLLGDREEPVSWLFNATGWGSDDSTAFTYLHWAFMR